MRSVAVQVDQDLRLPVGAGFNLRTVRVSGCKDEQDFAGQPLHIIKKFKKRKKVRAHTQLTVFSGLAFTSPAKTVTSLLTLPSVLVAANF
jgi:hypothetical protein